LLNRADCRGGRAIAYATLRSAAVVGIVEKRSRFIAHAAPVRSEEEALGFIQRIRGEHANASHNIFAYKVGAAARLSDDGEPSGTAGQPVFDVIEKQGISDTVIVVTRYFGGILLGAGGLVRAYSAAASAAVETAERLETIPAVDLRLRMAYSLLGKVQYLIAQIGALTVASEFSGEVLLHCRVHAAQASSLITQLAEISGGRILVDHLGDSQVREDLTLLE
jgi:uncharacterized YigZ family protein